LTDGTWDKIRYDDKYVLVLLDQNVQGAIESISEDSVRVKLWQSRDPEVDLFHITTEDGEELPFQRIGKNIVFAEPELVHSGVGVEITLPTSTGLRGTEKDDVISTLKEVLVGDAETGKQGLIPRNVFDAMARMEILPLIVFSLLLGAALSVLGERVRPTIEVISTLNDAVMLLVNWIMIIAPVGIFGLIAPRIGRAGGFGGFLPELLALGKYSLTVLIGLAIHGFIILPLILKILGRRSPATYAKGVGPALMNAFSTASSSATLPLTMKGIREENNISNRTASFVLPLGATINMDGTALYESVAAIFIAQVYGIPLSPVMQVVIFLTATLAAIGAAGIPEAGLVTMVIVLKAVGLPIEGIGLLLAIDWLLDRFRTTVNVWGDSVGAGVIETLEMETDGD
jgi:Na+/H+-dicarboxylate symporter